MGIRLGDGTDESKQRITKALANLWPYTGELFTNTATEDALLELGIIPNYSLIKQQWTDHIERVFTEAALEVPQNVFMQLGGKDGRHIEHLGYTLAELQYMQRAYPGLEW